MLYFGRQGRDVASRSAHGERACPGVGRLCASDDRRDGVVYLPGGGEEAGNLRVPAPRPLPPHCSMVPSAGAAALPQCPQVARRVVLAPVAQCLCARTAPPLCWLSGGPCLDWLRAGCACPRTRSSSGRSGALRGTLVPAYPRALGWSPAVVRPRAALHDLATPPLLLLLLLTHTVPLLCTPRVSRRCAQGTDPAPRQGCTIALPASRISASGSQRPWGGVCE